MTLFGGLAGFAVDAMAQPAILNRWQDGEYVNGQWVEGWVYPVAIRAVIQAPGESDIRLLPEGERIEAYVTIWTRSCIRTVDEEAGVAAETISTPNGQTYKITRVVERTEAGFYRAIARLIRDNPERSL